MMAVTCCSARVCEALGVLSSYACPAGLSDGHSKSLDQFDLVRDIDRVLPMEVQEQRMSGLIQSLLVAVCLRELSPQPLHSYFTSQPELQASVLIGVLLAFAFCLLQMGA